MVSTHREDVQRFFADPARYVTNNFYIELRSNIIENILPKYARKSILDLGAGDGRVSIPLVGSNDDLLLVDASQGMLDLAARNVPASVAGRVRMQCTDAATFAPTDLFDVVLCIGVLAHVDDWVSTIQLIARCVKPGGCAVIQITEDDHRLSRLTRWVLDLRAKVDKRSLSKFNRTTLCAVETEFERAGLSLATVRRYAVVPGLRFVPSRVARSLVRLASAPIVAEQGGEVLAMFVRK